MDNALDSGLADNEPSLRQRGEQRLKIESLTLPFLGSRESDHQAFQYLLSDISSHGACIALPNWVLARERLHLGERINLHVPFRYRDETHDQGLVAWERWDESLQAQLCGLSLENAPPPYYPVAINLESKLAELSLQEFNLPKGLLNWVMKDTYLLKRGVAIYLEHLIPYFSRVGDYPGEDFQALKEVFLLDVQARLEKSRLRLEEIYRSVSQSNLPDDEAIHLLDMEEIRALSESELSVDLLGATFASPLAIQQLAAIKALEKRLYANHNIMVMISLHSLASPAQLA